MENSRAHVELAIISDTHLPRGARRIPPDCLEHLRQAELILHAGDFTTLSVLRELEAINPVVGVHGNVDDREVRAALPESVLLPLGEGIQVVLVHDGGPSRGRLDRLRARFPTANAVIFGHSHLPLHERAADGFQIFNPGSPTERRRAPGHTMGMARTTPSGIEFRLIEIGLDR